MKPRATSYLMLALALLLGGCSLPIGGVPLPATPVPKANQVVYTGPYTSYLHGGELLPGTDIQYVGPSGDGWELRIAGQRAVKKVGDSLAWKGTAAPGVTLDYNLRVLGVFFDQFEAVGTVNVLVDDPQPAAGSPPEKTDLHFDKLVLSSSAKVGQKLSGTSIGYAGKTDKGAQLTGIEDYPYRQVGDSLDWTGQVRSNVWLKANLRVTSFDSKQLTADGTGELWIVLH